MTHYTPDYFDKVAGRARKSNPVTPQQEEFARHRRGEITPGVYSCCQVITETHVYLVTRTGKVKFSMPRKHRGKSYAPK